MTRVPIFTFISILSVFALVSCEPRSDPPAKLNRTPTAEEVSRSLPCETCPAGADCNMASIGPQSGPSAVSNLQCRIKADGVTAGCTFNVGKMQGGGLYSVSKKTGNWCGGGMLTDPKSGHDYSGYLSEK